MAAAAGKGGQGGWGGGLWSCCREAGGLERVKAAAEAASDSVPESAIPEKNSFTELHTSSCVED